MICVVLSRMQCGWTGLMWASERRYIATMKVLLEAKANPNITNEVKVCYSHCIISVT